MSSTNKKVMVTTSVFLSICIVLTVFVIFNGGKPLQNDGWFLPILVAQLWTVIISLKHY